MRISNSIYYLPAVALTLFFGMLAILIRDFAIFSVWVLVWIGVLYLAGTLLCKNKWFGGLLGMLPGLNMIYMGLQESGQVVNIEIPIGCVLVAFYLWCTWRVYKQNAK